MKKKTKENTAGPQLNFLAHRGITHAQLASPPLPSFADGVGHAVSHTPMRQPRILSHVRYATVGGTHVSAGPFLLSPFLCGCRMGHAGGCLVLHRARCGSMRGWEISPNPRHGNRRWVATERLILLGMTV